VPIANTMGMVEVAAFIASAETVVPVKTTVTLRPTSSAASAGNRLTSPSAKR